jgi:hypothetical protein
MMYSEILAAKPEVFFDNHSQSTIGYFPTQGADGYTQAGTWVSYNDLTSSQAIVGYQQARHLAGVFIYSSDMDTKEGDTWTYQLMNGIADAMHKPATPTPPPSPNPPPSPPTPPGGSCSAKSGSFCIAGDKSHYELCPQGQVMPCGTGTCCQQSTPNSIDCGFC